MIVAKTFSPATNHWKYANTPFDPVNSDHATNVAGIAAGDYDTVATIPGSRPHVSGIAPKAYLGNYKVLTVPTSQFGLDGNSPEIAKGIEEAVKDGMDVINLSLGEPEIEPSRDIVVAAIDNAANAGVVSVIAAGNEFEDAGKGSVGSPGTAPDAITVAASTEGDNGPADVIAGFSSSGPTPTSLQMKPDVTAPGVDILSSLPGNQWSDHDWSGTSMASPHVAGAAALAARAASGVDGGADQVGARVDRRPGAPGRLERRGVGAPRGRRADQRRARRQPADLHRSHRYLVRARQARHDELTAARARRRRRRTRPVDGGDRAAVRPDRSQLVAVRRRPQRPAARSRSRSPSRPTRPKEMRSASCS